MNALASKNDIMAQANRQHPASQSTQVEMSRAVAEVQAALVVARQYPRDEAKALERAMVSCRTMEVADGAFYKFPRGGETVQGETIQFAVELARCWGHIDYGIMELERDEVRGHTEMLAVAWDLETNTRSKQAFIVPHKRDTKNGSKPLTDMRDIYENNANNGARRLRECILRILPPYLKEAAKAACYATLSDGGEESLIVALANAVDAFAKIGISRERIEAKHGVIANMTPIDLANLKVAYRSISRKEISADEEFPKLGHAETAKDIAKLATKAAVDTVTKDNPAADEGAGDEGRGEAHNGADDDPRRALADKIIVQARNAMSPGDISQLSTVRAADIAAMPDEIKAEINTEIDAALARIKAAAKA